LIRSNYEAISGTFVFIKIYINIVILSSAARITSNLLSIKNYSIDKYCNLNSLSKGDIPGVFSISSNSVIASSNGATPFVLANSTIFLKTGFSPLFLFFEVLYSRG